MTHVRDSTTWPPLREAACAGTFAGVLVAEIEQLRALLRAILDADELGQWLPFSDAMKAAHVYLERTHARP